MSHINFSISIVSHGHKRFLLPLLEDMALLGRSDVEIILTFNLPEDLGIDYDAMPFRVKLIRNPSPKGFAENHNAAFNASSGAYFVVLNPDIRLDRDPFEALLALLKENPNTICAPIIMNEGGALEDSARNFPTPAFLVKKLFARIFKVRLSNESIRTEADVLMPDWVAGMFVVVPRAIYSGLRGLDERYHMYYEDVDFCARAGLAGYRILVSRHAVVIHEAQRDSHRKLRYLAWHLRSAFRFFTSSAYLKIQLNRLLRT